MDIFVSRDGQQFGPYSTEQVQQYLADGTLLTTDSAWYEGLDAWKPITSIIQAPVSQQPASPVRKVSTVRVPRSAMPQSQAPVTPRRPAENRRPVPVSAQKQGRSPWIWVGVSLLGVVTLWLGSTLFVSIATKSQFEKGHQDNKMASLGSYKMGLFSSRATSLVHFGDTKNMDDAMTIRHRIDHGPFVFSEKKKGLGAGYMTTSFEFLDQKTDGIPVSILSEVNFTGRSNHSVVFDPIDIKGDDNYHLTFDGGSINFQANPDRTEISGSINLSPIMLSMEEADISIDATNGTFDYQTRGVVEIDALIGGLKISSKSEGMEQSVTIEPPKLSADYHYYSKEMPLYVGTFSLTFPEMRLEGALPSSLKNLEFSSRAHVDTAKKFSASTRYEIGGATIGDPSAPMFDLAKTSLEFGYKGLDAELMAELSEENRQLYAAPIRALFDEQDISAIQSNAELEEATNRMLTLGLDLIRPGAEMFAKLKISGNDGLIDLSANFGGDKNLTDTKTLREVVSALEAAMKIQVKGALLESPLVGMSIAGYAEAGLGKLDKSGFRLDGAAREGTVFLGGEATPFIEALGPMLDEPIDWEEMLSAIKSGDPGP